jgi:repressor of nif and glnA expression
MTDYEKFMAEDARLVILKELASQTSGSLNEAILQKVLETFGHNRSREWVRTQLRKLDELGAVALVEAGSVMIARLKQAGLDHVERRSIIDGIARPSLEV